jgi:hypothetical protein
VVEHSEIEPFLADAAQAATLRELYGESPYMVTLVLDSSALSSSDAHRALLHIIDSAKPAWIEVNLVVLKPYIFLDKYSYLGMNSALNRYRPLNLDGYSALPFTELGGRPTRNHKGAEETMKNLKYFPFERSRYFYGKLLTVNDFETEQKYMNDKRRMVNRFLHGSGVVCGMNVVRVDDRTISVEMGLALDFAGREIVVDAPVIRKLDMIEGYDDTAGENGYLYLCVEYAEKETEPVHSIAGAGAHDTGEVENNKYAEGYRLFFTAQEPESEGFSVENYYQDTKTVYWGNGIRIKQSLRRFITAGAPAVLRVTVENMGQQQPFAFDYDLALTCLRHEGGGQAPRPLRRKGVPQGRAYTLDFPLTAMDVKGRRGRRPGGVRQSEAAGGR